MTEKWKELLKAPQGQRKVFILLAVLGIALVLLSGNGTAGSKSKSETTTARDYDAYVADLEGRLQKTVASMDGVASEMQTAAAARRTMCFMTRTAAKARCCSAPTCPMCRGWRWCAPAATIRLFERRSPPQSLLSLAYPQIEYPSQN